MKLTVYLCHRISEAIHGTTNGDLKPRRKLKNPHSLTWCVVLLFLSPQASELRTGIREEDQSGRKPRLHASADRKTTWRML